jgi:hypothetical protein
MGGQQSDARRCELRLQATVEGQAARREGSRTLNIGVVARLRRPDLHDCLLAPAEHLLGRAGRGLRDRNDRDADPLVEPEAAGRDRTSVEDRRCRPGPRCDRSREVWSLSDGRQRSPPGYSAVAAPIEEVAHRQRRCAAAELRRLLRLELPDVRRRELEPEWAARLDRARERDLAVEEHPESRP